MKITNDILIRNTLSWTLSLDREIAVGREEEKLDHAAKHLLLDDILAPPEHRPQAAGGCFVKCHRPLLPFGFLF